VAEFIIKKLGGFTDEEVVRIRDIAEVKVETSEKLSLLLQSQVVAKMRRLDVLPILFLRKVRLCSY
jgi:hypothetical protein